MIYNDDLLDHLYETVECDYEEGKIYDIETGRELFKSKHSQGYLMGQIPGTHINTYAHKILMAMYFAQWPPAGKETDHIDRNKTNNTISNLRWVTPSENNRNRGLMKGRKYIGAYKHGNKYQSRISFEGKRLYLGSFDTEEEAAAAYSAKAKELGLSRPDVSLKKSPFDFIKNIRYTFIRLFNHKP